MDAAMTEATEATDQDIDATQRLLALQLLSKRKQRLELQDKAQRQKWRETLDTCTRELHELIEEHTPTDGDEAKHHLGAIKVAYEAHKKAEKDKKGELDATKAAVAQVESAMYEVIHAADDGSQMNLDLGDGDEKGSWLNADVGKQIFRAIGEAADQGDESEDLDDLKAKLEDLGVAGLQLADDGEPDDESGDDEADGE